MGYEKYLGIPYRHLGRDRSGIDCYGLLLLYFKEEFNIELLDWWYESDWSKKGANYFIERSSMMSQRTQTPSKHDVVLFYTDIKNKVTNHAGIVVRSPNMVIQAMKHGVVLTDITKPIFRQRVEGFYRICLT